MQNVFTTDEKYEYMTKEGFLKYGKHHLISAALRVNNRENNIVAISSDGKLHWWKITVDDTNKDDKKEIVSDDVSKISDSKDMIQFKDKRSSLRGLKPRSKSDEVDKKSLWDLLASSTSKEKKPEEKIEGHGESKQTSPKQMSPKQMSPKQELRKKSAAAIAKQEKKRHSSPITLKDTSEDTTIERKNKTQSIFLASSPTVLKKTDINNIVEESKQYAIFSASSSPVTPRKTGEEKKRYSLPPVSSSITSPPKPISSLKSSSSPDIPRRKSSEQNIEGKK
jgi:hypothetical protein